jgi:hypothetical protein
VDAYDASTDSWTSRADLPTRRFDLAAGVSGGIIYAMGGDTDTGWVNTV